MKKIFSISFIIFLLDRLSKVLIDNIFELNVRNKIIDKFFYITKCHNDGAAFSLFSGNILFLIFITFIALYIIYKNISNKDISNISKISYGLLLGGIFGNLYDRIFYGYVIDFFDFIFFKYNFAIFNVADVCIILGIVMLMLFEGSDKDGKGNKSCS